jgi:hypothetical protein
MGEVAILLLVGVVVRLLVGVLRMEAAAIRLIQAMAVRVRRMEAVAAADRPTAEGEVVLLILDLPDPVIPIPDQAAAAILTLAGATRERTKP